jgi:hypothetical protein
MPFKETNMQMMKLVTGSIAMLLLAVTYSVAQDKTPQPDVPLRVTVVFNEYDGTKKIASLPYVMPCKASKSYDRSSLKMGFRVPYKVKQDEIQFQDVGTHIECGSTAPNEKGEFMVRLGVDHSTVYSPSHGSDTAVQWHPGESLADDPVFGEIAANMVDLLLHDGQTVEAMTATDPVSGHVWRVEVTLNVVK